MVVVRRWAVQEAELRLTAVQLTAMRLTAERVSALVQL